MRRTVEIPALDNGDAADSGSSSLPRKRSWLFALPPYIRDLDLGREVIVVSNPERAELDLTGHYLVDKARAHRFDFEDGYTLPPLADVHVYCAPGKHPVEEDEDDAPEHFLVWTNKDGRPRRKEVLNPDGDTVLLMDPNDVEIAALEVTDAGVKRLRLPRLELLQSTYAGNVVAALQGCRLGLLVMAFALLLADGLQPFLGLQVGALLLDLVARLSDSLRRPKSRGRVLAVLGDRVGTVGLLAALMVGTIQPNGRFYGPNAVERVNLAMFLLLADLLAPFAELLVEATALASAAAFSPFMPKAEALAPQVGKHHKRATAFVQRHAAAQAAITLVTAGTHLFLLYCVAALADKQEGQEQGQGCVLRAILRLHAFLARLSVPTHQGGLALALCCVMYRFGLVWLSFLDLLDARF